MGEVVNFGGATVLDIPPAAVLEAALENKVCKVIVIGETPDGEPYHASAIGDIAEQLLAIEIFKARLIELATS
jgi:hypothetical protein